MVSTYPSEKWWSSSVGMMTFPTEWKNKKRSKPPTSLKKWIFRCGIKSFPHCFARFITSMFVALTSWPSFKKLTTLRSSNVAMDSSPLLDAFFSETLHLVKKSIATKRQRRTSIGFTMFQIPSDDPKIAVWNQEFLDRPDPGHRTFSPWNLLNWVKTEF